MDLSVVADCGTGSVGLAIEVVVTRRVRGLGTEAREMSDAAVAGVDGCGLITGGVATMAASLVIGVAGLSVLNAFADEPDPTAAVALAGGISIFAGF